MNNTDAEVCACAEDCIADLWVYALDVVRAKDGKAWQAICRAQETQPGLCMLSPWYRGSPDERCMSRVMRRVDDGTAEEEWKGRQNGAFHL